jgi:hypothetical protein
MSRLVIFPGVATVVIAAILTAVSVRAEARQLMTQKDSLSDALHERLDKLGEQLERAWDEAEQAYLDLAEQQRARREEFRAMALEYQRGWQELSEKAIRYCAGRAGSQPHQREP